MKRAAAAHRRPSDRGEGREARCTPDPGRRRAAIREEPRKEPRETRIAVGWKEPAGQMEDEQERAERGEEAIAGPARERERAL